MLSTCICNKDLIDLSFNYQYLSSSFLFDMLEKGLELTTVVFLKNLRISSYDIYQVNNSKKNCHVSNVFICITLGMYKFS